MTPPKKIIIAMRLIQCITFRLKLVGLFGSAFLKKYILTKLRNKKKGVLIRTPFL